MKKSSDHSKVKEIETLMDLFPDPRTIPHGWDLSEMPTTPETSFENPVETNPTTETGSDLWVNL
jgi:hypothetical protein